MNSPSNDSRNSGGNALTRAEGGPSVDLIPLIPKKLPTDPAEAGMVKQMWFAMRQCALEGEPHLWLSRVGQAVEAGREFILGMEEMAATSNSYKLDFDRARPFLDDAVRQFEALAAA